MTGVNARIQNSSVVFHEQSSQVMNMSTKPTYKELEQRVQELEQSESERKKTGELLWQQKEIFSLLVNYSSDILVLIDKNGEQKFISPSAEKITGYTVGELQRPFAEIIHPEDLHQVERGFEELLNNPEAVVTVNYRHKHKDGGYRYFETVGRNFLDNPLVQGIVANVRDISDRKQAEEALSEIEGKYKSLTNNLNVGVYRNSVGSKGKFIEANPAIVKMFGYDSREEFLKIGVSDLYKDPLERKEFTFKIAKTGSIKNEMLKLQKKDGTGLIGSVSAVAVKNKKGDIKYFDGIIEDITERKWAEEALRESEEKFRSLAENQHDVVWTVNENLEVDYISPSCFKTTGTTAEKTMGMNPKDFYTEESYQRIVLTLAEERQKPANEMQPAVLEVDQYHEDGHLFPVEITCMPIIIDDRFIGVQGISRDITEKKKAEEDIRKLSTAVEQSPSVIAITDLNGKLEYVNSKFTELTGYTREEAFNNNPRILKSGDQPSEMYKELWETISSGDIWRGEFHNKKKNGELFWEAASVSPILDKQGKITGYIKVGENITERKQAEEALVFERAQLLSIFDSIDQIIYVTDPNTYEILYVNHALKDAFQKKLIGGVCYREFQGLDAPCEFCTNEIILKQNPAPHQWEYHNPTLDKDLAIVDRIIKWPDGRDVRFEIAIDVTEQVRAEKEKKKLGTKLERAQKMEAIGTLAGGVAHDLNNILGGFVSYPELLLLQLPEESPLRKSILTIQKSGVKAAAVVQDLLTLARRGVVFTEVVNLNDVIAEYLKSPEHENLQSYHPGVHIETHLETDLLNILGSSTHLSKTVMNLTSNAAEAMLEGGTLTVTTENQYIDRPIRGYDDVKQGDYVVLTVSDTGTGIDPDDMEKIFEPFYTKKKMGRSGTGLGMAVVWGTVKDHNGYIHVQSTEGRGTTFTLYFPVTRKSVEEKSEISLKDFMGKGEAILVVDDVEEQRQIASGMLKELGYSVVAVSSGEETVEYLRTNKVDLLVLDMIMDPGMDGLDTYKKILEIHPSQKAIIASGFSETGRVKELQSLGAGTYIRKPFLLEKIGLAVKEELEK